MTFAIDLTEEQSAIKHAIEEICAKYDDHYWLRGRERRSFRTRSSNDIAEGGWLGVAMPESVRRRGAWTHRSCADDADGGAIRRGFFWRERDPPQHFRPDADREVRHAEEQQARFLPPAMDGTDKACFAVTEPNSGLDTSSLETRAERTNSGYRINGRKIWTTNAQRANKILIIARTTPKDQVKRPTEGLSLFYADFDRKRSKRSRSRKWVARRWSATRSSSRTSKSRTPS
jgi:acyl-CoA dehydrogenase